MNIVKGRSLTGAEPVVELVILHSDEIQFFANYGNDSYQILQANGFLETSNGANYRIVISKFLNSKGEWVAGERVFSMPEGIHMGD